MKTRLAHRVKHTGAEKSKWLTDGDRCVNSLHIAFFNQNLKRFLTESLDLRLFQSFALLQLLYPPVNLRAHTNHLFGRDLGQRSAQPPCRHCHPAGPDFDGCVSDQAAGDNCTSDAKDVAALAEPVQGRRNDSGSIRAVVRSQVSGAAKGSSQLAPPHSEGRTQFGGN